MFSSTKSLGGGFDQPAWTPVVKLLSLNVIKIKDTAKSKECSYVDVKYNYVIKTNLVQLYETLALMISARYHGVFGISTLRLRSTCCSAQLFGWHTCWVNPVRVKIVFSYIYKILIYIYTYIYVFVCVGC